MASPFTDRTSEFWADVNASAASAGMTEDRVRKLKSAQILRSLAQKSDFNLAAVEVARNINALSEYVREHQRAYVQAGCCSEAERDRIEEQVGLFVRTCNSNIVRLEASVQQQQEQQQGRQPGAAQAINPHVTAHRHGIALILSERLQAVGAAFDRCRAVRYAQLQKQQRHLAARQQALAASLLDSDAHRLEQAAQLHQNPLPQEQQQALDEENAALAAELSSLNRSARGVEVTMRELATLNQMFSTQVAHQVEQIDQLYQQAVQATLYTGKGNVQLGKALKLGASSRLYLLWFFVIASLALLFLDWFSS